MIVPNKNLIGNIGCNDLEGLHANGKYDPRGDIPIEHIDEIKHPEFVIRNREADQHIFDVIHGGKEIRWRDKPLVKSLRVLSFPIPSSVKKILKRFLKG